MLSRLRARHGRNAELLESHPIKFKQLPNPKANADDDESEYHEPDNERSRSEGDSDFENDSAVRKRANRTNQNRKRKVAALNDPKPEAVENAAGCARSQLTASEKTPKRRNPSSRKARKLDGGNITLGQLQKAFYLLDRDSKGILTRKDLQDAISEIGADPLTDQDAVEMLREADRRGDRNGSVNVADFLTMMESVFPHAFQAA